jgi:hypothetical protein
MPEDIIDKILIVTSVTVATNLGTGEPMYQVMFGEYLDTTPEVISRLPPPIRDANWGKKIASNELILFINTPEVPYKAGSKWRLRIRKNGTLNLVEEK